MAGEVRRYRSWPRARVLGGGALLLLVVATTVAFARPGAGGTVAPARSLQHARAAGHAHAARRTARQHRAASASRLGRSTAVTQATAINTSFPGITTFRGNATRSYYGAGPVPLHPQILWRFPREGSLCSFSNDEHGRERWCGLGWTGQPNVVPRVGGRGFEVRFGAYDDRYHFVDATTGVPVRPDLVTGDLAKGSATSDADGYPLYYGGSRDNFLRVVALDRPRPTVLFALNADTSVPRPVWNNDWDGAPLQIGDYLIEGGENSWLYVIRLHRRYDRQGKVAVSPRVVARVPGFDEQLFRDIHDRDVSIESSVAFRRGIVYFANSGGLVQGWDIRRILRGGTAIRRVFRFWTGDDTDATVVIDREGYLYVASELQRFDARSTRVGQLMKLDPRRPARPLVWSVPVAQKGFEGNGGIWSTPAIYGGVLYVATNAGGLLAVDRRSGGVLWRLRLPGPTWASPVVVDDVLLQGDCTGVLHAYDVSKPRALPHEVWRVSLGRACIESTPAVFRGVIWIGTRGGHLWALGDPAAARTLASIRSTR